MSWGFQPEARAQKAIPARMKISSTYAHMTHAYRATHVRGILMFSVTSGTGYSRRSRVWLPMTGYGEETGRPNRLGGCLFMPITRNPCVTNTEHRSMTSFVHCVHSCALILRASSRPTSLSFHRGIVNGDFKIGFAAFDLDGMDDLLLVRLVQSLFFLYL